MIYFLLLNAGDIAQQLQQIEEGRQKRAEERAQAKIQRMEEAQVAQQRAEQNLATIGRLGEGRREQFEKAKADYNTAKEEQKARILNEIQTKLTEAQQQSEGDINVLKDNVIGIINDNFSAFSTALQEKLNNINQVQRVVNTILQSFNDAVNGISVANIVISDTEKVAVIGALTATIPQLQTDTGGTALAIKKAIEAIGIEGKFKANELIEDINASAQDVIEIKSLFQLIVNSFDRVIQEHTELREKLKQSIEQAFTDRNQAVSTTATSTSPNAVVQSAYDAIIPFIEQLLDHTELKKGRDDARQKIEDTYKQELGKIQ